MEKTGVWWQPDASLWREVYLALQKILAAGILVLGHKGLDFVLDWSNGANFPAVTRILQVYFIVAFGIVEARLVLDAVLVFVLAPLPGRGEDDVVAGSAGGPEK